MWVGSTRARAEAPVVSLVWSEWWPSVARARWCWSRGWSAEPAAAISKWMSAMPPRGGGSGSGAVVSPSLKVAR